MVIKNRFILVLWTKVALALEGLLYYPFFYDLPQISTLMSPTRHPEHPIIRTLGTLSGVRVMKQGEGYPAAKSLSDTPIEMNYFNRIQFSNKSPLVIIEVPYEFFVNILIFAEMNYALNVVWVVVVHRVVCKRLLIKNEK